MIEERVSRRGVIRGATVGGIAGLAGCAGLTGDTELGGGTLPETDDTAVEVDEIDVWGWDVAARALDGRTGAFEDDHDVDVSVTELGNDTMKSAFLDTLQSGRGMPDLAMMEYSDGPAWIDETDTDVTGGLKPLTDRIDDAGMHEEFVPGVWESITVGDDVYAVPWDIGPVGVFYRRSVYDEYGIDPDDIETWDDFIEEGSKLPDDEYLLNINNVDYGGFWRWQFRQEGVQPITDAGTVNIDHEVSIEIARTMQRLVDTGVAQHIEAWSSTWYRQLREGTLASVVAGSWIEGILRANLEETDGDWGVYLPPAKEPGGSRASNWGGSSLVIPADIDDARADVAWEFAQFVLANEEMQRRMYDNYGLFPAYEPTYDHERFDQPNEFFGGQRVARLFADVAPEIEGYQFTRYTDEITEAINDQFGALLAGETSPEAAVDDAAQQVADETGLDRAN